MSPPEMHASGIVRFTVEVLHIPRRQSSPDSFGLRLVESLGSPLLEALLESWVCAVVLAEVEPSRSLVLAFAVMLNRSRSYLSESYEESQGLEFNMDNECTTHMSEPLLAFTVSKISFPVPFAILVTLFITVAE